jgi:hypothetical protein
MYRGSDVETGGRSVRDIGLKWKSGVVRSLGLVIERGSKNKKTKLKKKILTFIFENLTVF